MPAARGVALVAVRKLVDQALEQVPSRPIESIRIEAREAEHRVCRCSQGHVAGERADETPQEVARRSDDGGSPRRRKELPERPDRAAEVIADVRFVEPAPVVAHEVAHSALAFGRVQERERPVEGRCPRLLVTAARELE